MKTPQEKYNNDPHYKRLVDTLYVCIEQGDFTPSELREAVVYACIRYESMNIKSIVIPRHINEAFMELERFATESVKGGK